MHARMCAQRKAVVENTAALKELQETPDAPEALGCIPALQLSDIPKSITKVGGWGTPLPSLACLLLCMGCACMPVCLCLCVPVCPA